MPGQLTELRERLAEFTDLRRAAQLLEWDQQTMMPPRGAPARAEALATLERISHDMFVSAETGNLLESAAAGLNGADPDSDDVRLVAVVRRHWEKDRRVPTELAADMVRAASIGQEVWATARANSDFASFAPYLERTIELKRRYVECFEGFEGFECPYDVLLDDFEPQMTTREVSSLFAELKSELAPVIAKIVEQGGAVDASPVHGHFPLAGQRELVAGVVRLMGFDRAGWRLDDTVHPFASGISHGDVRITNRWDETYLSAGLYGAMHECGHGLYEAGVDPALERTPLGQGESLGLHESQSRLWENMVGRSRAFSGVLAPRVAELFGGSLAQLDADSLYRAVNRVEPTFIRVEADEATYGLHIVLRFELEQELIEGRVAVRELPEVWNARFKEYLGLDVQDDADGVLQDIHWSAGLVGYFPTYALGNLIAGQLWERAHADIGGLDDLLASGQLAPLREWLREHIHRHGAKYPTRELLERVVGGPIAVGPFVAYLKAKLGDAYGLEL
jgi:carboxypeptidase Taq